MSKSEKLHLLSAHISKGLCERILTLSVSEGSGSEHELLLEFGDASNSDENEPKESEIEDEDELPVGDWVNSYGRRVGNWRLRCSS